MAPGFHLGSTTANATQGGGEFGEILTITYPFIKVQRPTYYGVKLSRHADAFGIQAAHRPSIWQSATTQARDNGTRFVRTLTYKFRGLLRLFGPLGTASHPRQSALVPRDLKQKLDSRNAAPPGKAKTVHPIKRVYALLMGDE